MTTYHQISITLDDDQMERLIRLTEKTESRSEEETCIKALAALDRVITGTRDTPFIDYLHEYGSEESNAQKTGEKSNEG